MPNNSSKPATPILKNITRAFLIVGFVFSALGFLSAIGLLLLYFGIYILAFLVIAVITIVILIISGFTMLIGLFITAFFAALFGGVSMDSISTSFDTIIQEVFPTTLWQDFGISSLWYLIGLPITITLLCTSLIAMIFSIIALVRLSNAESKTGGVVGGVFAVISSLIGFFSIHEFIGGILMCIIPAWQYELDNEEFKNNSRIKAIEYKK